MSVAEGIVDWAVVKKIIDGNDDLSETNKSLLKQIPCSATLLFTSNAVKRILAIEPSTHKDLKTEEIDLGWTKNCFGDWKPKRVRHLMLDISPSLQKKLLREDDNFEEKKYDFSKEVRNSILESPLLFPLNDFDVHLEDNAAGAALFKDLKLVQGLALPQSYNRNFDMETDESFSRIFFYHLGCTLLVRQDADVPENSDFGPFVVDMPFHELKVRPLYREYGARVHFNNEQHVTAIYDYKNETLVKPGENGWDEAKLLAKVTAFLLVTAREHLIWTHFLCANDTTRECTLLLPPDHPVRRLLTVFTFHTNGINLGAQFSLLPEHSILHRASGLEYESLRAVFELAHETCNIYEPFSSRTYAPAVQKLAEEGKLPYVTHGSEYYEIVKKFVEDWLEKGGGDAIVTDPKTQEFYSEIRKTTLGFTKGYVLPEPHSKENLVNLFSSIIFAVTCWHELVGYAVDYVLLPTTAGVRITKNNPSRIDLQSYLLSGVIGAATSLRMPNLMRSFPAYFGAGGSPAWEREAWTTFQAGLRAQSTKVKADQKKTNVEFKFFDPENFECSVSV